MSFRARLLLIASFAIVALVCARLGLWQLERLGQRRAANATALEARSQARIGIGDDSPANTGLSGREVWAVGRYDHQHDVVLRGKVYRGSPGVEIVSPLVLADGRTAVLVNRGFMPTPDAVTVQTDSIREPGEVQVDGIALSLQSGGGAPLERAGRTTWARLDPAGLARWMPYTLAPVYIRQTPDSTLPRFPRRLDPPPIDDGSHLSYAIQWFAFAGMAIVFGVVVWRQRREQDVTRADPSLRSP